MASSNSPIRIKRGELNGELCNIFRDKLANFMLSIPGVDDSEYNAPDDETPRKKVLPDDSVFLYAETGPESSPVPVGSLCLVQIHSDSAHFKRLPSELDRVGEMKRMITLDGYQRLGVGKRLIEAMESIAREELGLKCLVVETMPELVGAQRLYESAGYVRREVWGLYGEGSLCFEKWL
jgi:ribosomal protein S18 acetylase RimI-like enzyme